MPRKTSAASSRRPWKRSFNEAAARCRGKRAAVRALCADQDASMRPRPDAAENRPTPAGVRSPSRFNEAAARCRGKRALARALLRRNSELQ